MTEIDKFPLNERTVKFAEDIIDLCKSVKSSSISHPIIAQLVRSGTSIGANYAEATAASSKKDFRNKIFFCKKEAQETRYWLNLLIKAGGKNDLSAKLADECQQLVLIFQRITSTIDGKK
ncbi:hypothetical protein A3A71_00390 [Candidatus Berkelbacteria bacterium RIFCSPLOWO2_01_FULL_50_28]|uniref:Four helix bundle protein n=1 Tax=Candidatus Berkelbacteria bacterium RIFCSPLOWO2_01_FULL_50_28 TaxID=1797471 RepID=A0A1F5EB65_9BACT|nr:MAG: hypothetical protein A2807_01145 [Candidatus Berkelbacteria bacterium RIFCSPHIGHO2_01_FULL_50_36]OGD63558.1 MAG: hypothetical protein A3F39_02540 [Candidatus Berkelbacteria bacterium RIFCSPHIGHO2_12_FULL_50_11]OGD64506.1 MAG: hypothetical protein A3A71_00390 [Candidatus Berkelbacteria bacterium RIFCSPLOWO2_01_FULL_50_28]